MAILKYFLDKSLSLRLGRSASLQDFDISTSLEDVLGTQEGKESGGWANYLKLSVEMATIQVGIS